jgi:hypothetical protein
MANLSASLSLQFPTADVNRMVAQMARARTELRKSNKQVTQWAGEAVCGSLAASTKESAKLRPIVRNPDPRAGKDARLAIFGVNRYWKGKQVFQPIYKGGEFGQQIRYTRKGYVLLKVGGEWVEYKRGIDEASGLTITGLEGHPKRKILRRGLAKKVWQWCKSHTRSSGSGTIMGMPYLAVIRWTGADRSTLEMTSRLRYAMDALKNGGSEINQVMMKAADNMSYRIGLKMAEIAKGITR